MLHPSEAMTYKIMLQLATEAYTSTQKTSSILNGFKTTGLFPLDRQRCLDACMKKKRKRSTDADTMDAKENLPPGANILNWVTTPARVNWKEHLKSANCSDDAKAHAQFIMKKVPKDLRQYIHGDILDICTANYDLRHAPREKGKRVTTLKYTVPGLALTPLITRSHSAFVNADQ
jgi:hypothetical protein